MNFPVRTIKKSVFNGKVLGFLVAPPFHFLLVADLRSNSTRTWAEAKRTWTYSSSGRILRKSLRLSINQDSNLNSPFRTGLGRFIARMILWILFLTLETASVKLTIVGSNTQCAGKFSASR